MIGVRRVCVVVAIGAVTWAGQGCGGAGPADGPHATSTSTPAAHTRDPVKVQPVLTVRRAGRLPAPVQLPAVAGLASGGAQVMGGLDAADASVDAIVRVHGRRAVQVGQLPGALHDAGAARIGTRVFFFGGGNAGSTSADVLEVAPGGGARHAGKLPVGASDVGAATVGHTAYVVGGYTGTVPLRSIVAYQPAQAPHVVATMPRSLRYAAVAAVGSSVLIAGGTSGTAATRGILRFDPGSGRVRRIGTLPAPLTHAAGLALGGRFYVVGGRGDDLSSQRSAILSIDVASGRVRHAGRLPVALSDAGAASLGRNAIVVGGRDAQGIVHDEVWRLAMGTKTARRHIAAAPALVNRRDVYAADRPGLLSPTVRSDPARVYVPNSQSNTVDVISQRTGKVIRHFSVGQLPQHVTPSWDLKTLWVTNDKGNSLTPVDPRTSRPGKRVPVTDPYNLYFTANGRFAIVVAEAHQQLDFRFAHSMKLHHTLALPSCKGVDHMDFTANGRDALVSCEFAGRTVVVDLARERVRKTIPLRARRHAPGRQALAGREDVLRRRHGLERRVGDRRAADAQARVHLDRGRRARPLPQPRLALPLRLQPRRRLHLRHLVPPAPGGQDMAPAWRRLPGHGRRIGERPGAVALGPLQQRGLRDLHPHRPAASAGSRSGRAPTGCASGRSPAGTRSGTRGSCDRRQPASARPASRHDPPP